MKAYKLLLISSIASLMVAEPVLAHTQWLRPNLFNTALHDKTVWMSGQLSVSEAAFNPERNFAVQQLVVTTPDGKQQTITDIFTGHTASAFDYELSQAGTYKVEALAGPSIRQRKKSTKLGAKSFPKTKTVSRLTTYITADAPNKAALSPSNTWLEIIPITHPADIVAEESVEFKVLYNGKILSEQIVTLIPAGGEYSNQNMAKEYITDEKGLVVITLSNAGVYLLKARHNETLFNDPQAERLRSNAGLTFEAQVN